MGDNMLKRTTGIIYNLDLYEDYEALDNLESIRQEANKMDEYIPLIFCDNEINTSYALYEYITKIIGHDPRQIYNSFIKKIDFEEDSEGIIYGNYYLRHVSKVELPYLDNWDSALTLIHEFMHYYNYKYIPKSFDDAHYSELTPIFNEYLFSRFYDEKYYKKDNSLMNDTIKFRIYYDLFINEEVNTYHNKEKIKNDYDKLETMEYMISNVFSNRLLYYYLDDYKNFLKQYQSLLKGSSKVENLLKYYNISLHNFETIDTTLKLIKKL
jgi:hypothetical protein